ncbi:39S ribosomal protein L52, mitochondrial [Lamellibrachia satsuma]|nr:39S ribosomal protein L52, mitochondrial [Lamellibrachia satsuma]
MVSLAWEVGCQCSHRAFRTSSAAFAGGKWRLERGMSASGNEYGPLVDIPDWSYADGRPAPLGRREIARRERRRDCAMRVVELIDEMKFAKKNYARKQKLQEEEKNRLISRKLKSRTS